MRRKTIAPDARELLKKLEGGDRRSIGRSSEVVMDVLNNPDLFGAVFDGMRHANPLIAMRAADAAEKISARHPEYLRPYKDELVHQLASVTQKEIRWHLAQMISRIELNHKERKQVSRVLLDYLHDRSSIVKTFTMQALADMAGADARLRPAILAHLNELTATGTPAMRSRGKKLLSMLDPARKHPVHTE